MEKDDEKFEQLTGEYEPPDVDWGGLGDDTDYAAPPEFDADFFDGTEFWHRLEIDEHGDRQMRADGFIDGVPDQPSSPWSRSHRPAARAVKGRFWRRHLVGNCGAQPGASRCWASRISAATRSSTSASSENVCQRCTALTT